MERELRAMTAQMNELHQETFPQLRESLGDLGSGLRVERSTTTRPPGASHPEARRDSTAAREVSSTS